MRREAGTIGKQAAEQLAAEALAWIAADPELLARFLGLSGIEGAQIRRAAAEPRFLAGVLEFLLGHEPDLIAFASHSANSPETIVQAHATLAGP